MARLYGAVRTAVVTQCCLTTAASESNRGSGTTPKAVARSGMTPTTGCDGRRDAQASPE